MLFLMAEGSDGGVLMNKIVREHYPVEKLPADLREGIFTSTVTVTIEREVDLQSFLATQPFATADEFKNATLNTGRSKTAIDTELRQGRDD